MSYSLNTWKSWRGTVTLAEGGLRRPVWWIEECLDHETMAVAMGIKLNALADVWIHRLGLKASEVEAKTLEIVRVDNPDATASSLGSLVRLPELRYEAVVALAEEAGKRLERSPSLPWQA